jgi:hypothetical protein
MPHGNPVCQPTVILTEGRARCRFSPCGLSHENPTRSVVCDRDASLPEYIPLRPAHQREKRKACSAFRLAAWPSATAREAKRAFNPGPALAPRARNPVIPSLPRNRHRCAASIFSMSPLRFIMPERSVGRVISTPEAPMGILRKAQDDSLFDAILARMTISSYAATDAACSIAARMSS